MPSTDAEQEYVSLAEQAYRALRDRLILLEIPPGAPINEGHLAAELGIGRTPIREGLKKLELEHLVVSYPRRGTFATQVDITDLADISEVRQVLEPLAARRAARLARPQVRAELDAAARQIASMEREPADTRSLMELDLSVHRLIYRAAENPHMTETLVRLDNLATRIWCLVLDRLPSAFEHVREHAALLEAIVDRDADRAAELASDHVRDFEQAIRAVLYEPARG
ncbi:DNA-binding GntR family transcriptional regulator [Georgenia soli]|uniref:DNA-binding GntR family transcriptional regulator n=1 Tax=Georgenia soli TaxID=638953 RepID=A0A2A9ENE0_9MICO|nr:GntR family transcriptional regulator [Georgenia soli]PFG40116.1 DNA-binding GntR family transcriptional regulator [Georgenia soli]